jgi:hypothetical protein
MMYFAPNKAYSVRIAESARDFLQFRVHKVGEPVYDENSYYTAYEVSGDRVRFFRKDFLQKIGELPPDLPERTTAQALEQIWEVLADIRILLKAIANEKTAGAATPTE